MKIFARFAAALPAILCLAAHAADDAATNATSADGSQFLPWDKGSITLGGFIASFDDSLGFGVNGVGGAVVSPEKLLGLASTLTVFRVDALYRPGKSRRNQLDFTYASYQRSGSGTLSQVLDIGGNQYPIGASVSSHLNFDIIRGTYSYAILQDDRMRIALGLSVYAVPLSYGLNIGTAGGFTSVGGADTTIPLPAVALRSEFQLVPKLFLNASVDFMYLEIGNFKGSLEDLNAGLEYRLWKHFGLGLGANLTDMEVASQSTHERYPGANFIGAVNIRYTGLMLYGKFAF